jgi:hypothetical protein
MQSKVEGQATERASWKKMSIGFLARHVFRNVAEGNSNVLRGR